ncbi:hypothetical protein [uncultured Ferrovibrio sp.]|jgi:hypothetical protein|uniref:hypothetical protein n=1 Tax=uncultured Ferrovibrio sp. TaxID=1576913 RepID=UPI00260CA498|nr:hypothetical protein [uncultured Ferrovibrio sp.]
MSTVLLILAFFLIGVPGVVFVILQAIAAHKRANLAYDWSRSEIARRTQRAHELEMAIGKERDTIGRLMKDVAALTAQRSKLEAMLEQSKSQQQ